MPSLDAVSFISPGSLGAGIEVTVASIASPTELNSRPAAQGDIILARTTEAGTGTQTWYYADTTSDAEALPWIVSSATAGVKFIAVAGAYANTANVKDSSFAICGNGDISKRLVVEVDAQTTGDTLTLSTGAQTDSRTLSVPVLTGNATLATISQAQSFTGVQTFTDTTDSTSKDTGSIVTEGGIGVEKAIVAGTGFGMGEAPVSTASPFTAVGTVDGGLYYRIKNGSNGASAQADFRAFNDGDQFIQFGIASSGKTTYGSIIANRSFLYCFNAAGLTFMADNASAPIVFSSGGNSEKARFSSAGNLLLGTTSDTGITGAGGISVANTTDSTSKDTGSIVTEGGIGAEKAIRSGTRFGLTQAAGSTTDGDIWSDSTQKALQAYVDGIEQTLSGCVFTQTATRTIANTVTETSLFTTGVGTLTLPANFFLAGKTIRLVLTGTLADTGTPTVRLRLKYGSTTVIDSTAQTLAALTGTEEWRATCELTCRAAGASGTIAGDIWFAYDTATGTGAIQGLNIAPTTATVDTTASGAIDLTWEWGAEDVANTVSCVIASVEVIN